MEARFRKTPDCVPEWPLSRVPGPPGETGYEYGAAPRADAAPACRQNRIVMPPDSSNWFDYCASAPVPVRAVLTSMRNAFVTACVTGDLFIVLPALIEQSKLLLRPHAAVRAAGISRPRVPHAHDGVED
jgi:hypothetical protein